MSSIVHVALGERSYDILIRDGLLGQLPELLRPLKLGRCCAILTDATVSPRYATAVRDALTAAAWSVSVHTVPSGESSKSLSVAGKLYEELAEARLNRRSFVLALGGGVVGDLAGFIAATFLRGVDFVQVPTTLLAMVDSSVGGKVAINLPQGKNLVGAFYQPRIVVADTATLASLPEREFRAGVAEVIKYGVIYDAVLFAELERELPALMAKDAAVLGRVIARCCEIKADVVSKDERESGLREILNFGHTVGHAIEAVTEYGTYLHGEAIAIGMVAAARLSQKHGGLAEADVARIEALLRRAGFDLQPPDVSFDQLLDAMRSDKKARDGGLRFVLARRIGEVFSSDAVSESDIKEVLHVSRR
ncbi:MAG: 3-dehydroquinate synthase [Verrucomicrobia bacterium]|nr:3-dehydroquinate synthase [Verrucomicrobiota bacterium]